MDAAYYNDKGVFGVQSNLKKKSKLNDGPSLMVPLLRQNVLCEISMIQMQN